MMWTIGILAKKAGVSRDTLRYYEKIGLLKPRCRTASRYRLYDAEAMRRVELIRNGLRFGFTLREIAGFLRAKERGRPPCREVRAAGEQMLKTMDDQIHSLLLARDSVARTLQDWDDKLEGQAGGLPAHLLESLPGDSPVVPRPRWQRRLKNHA